MEDQNTDLVPQSTATPTTDTVTPNINPAPVAPAAPIPVAPSNPVSMPVAPPMPSVAAPVPVQTPAPTLAQSSMTKRSRIGLLSLIGGIVTSGGAVAIANTPFTTSDPSTLVKLLYTVTLIVSLVCIFLFSIPSYKKNAYPNIMGTVGLLLCVIAVYESVSALITLLTVGV